MWQIRCQEWFFKNSLNFETRAFSCALGSSGDTSFADIISSFYWFYKGSGCLHNGIYFRMTTLEFETSSCEEIDFIIGEEFEKFGFYIFFFLSKLQKYYSQKSKRWEMKMANSRISKLSFLKVITWVIPWNRSSRLSPISFHFNLSAFVAPPEVRIRSYAIILAEVINRMFHPLNGCTEIWKWESCTFIQWILTVEIYLVTEATIFSFPILNSIIYHRSWIRDSK